VYVIFTTIGQQKTDTFHGWEQPKKKKKERKKRKEKKEEEEERKKEKRCFLLQSLSS
jgi:hypothetical protein